MSTSTGTWISYGLLGLSVALVLKRLLTGLIARRKIPEILKQGAQIVDVRSPGEFASRHAASSRNIPLNDLGQEAKRLDPNRWVVVCCASGTRSAMARRQLRRQGFRRVLNAGSWRNLP